MNRYGMADINVISLADHGGRDPVSSLLHSVLFASSHANSRNANVVSEKNQTEDITYTVTTTRTLLVDQAKAFSSVKTFELVGPVDS